MKTLRYSVKNQYSRTAEFSNKAEAIKYARSLAADGWPASVTDMSDGTVVFYRS